MTADRWVTVWCDVKAGAIADPCFVHLETPCQLIPEGRAFAREQGWKASSRGDVCPACQRDPEANQ